MILFLTHYFHPEGNAPATRVTELTRSWVAAGHDVTVVTGVPNVPDGVVYEGYRNRPLQRERRDGVDVIRVWTYLAPNKGTARRILNYVSFMLTATLAGLCVRRPDVVIATSPQFFCGWAGVLVVARAAAALRARDPRPVARVDRGGRRHAQPAPAALPRVARAAHVRGGDAHRHGRGGLPRQAGGEGASIRRAST